MIHADYLYILIGMGIVTYVPRWLPLVFLSRLRLPEWFEQWLDLIPAAILSSLILPILITTGEPRQLDLLRPELIVAVPTFLFAIKTRSLAGTVVVGMFLFWLAGKFL
ncbi:MAG TPA: AzlD domain-containing protein [Syntrophales bacterium]|nr:AzlD domain-containing protein [Syntrophales bacterium]HPQ45354.1 AzlD domain-containing protein [Syntrophales bacterium]